MIQLTPAEKAIRANLKALSDKITARTVSFGGGPEVSDAENNADHAAMESYARSLHDALVKRGCTPEHDKTLVKNRGLQPSQNGFYEHLHTVESLLNQTE